MGRKGGAYLLNECKADIMKPTIKHIRVIPFQTAQEREPLDFFLPVGREKIYIATL